MTPTTTRPAALLVTDPNGNRTTVHITTSPFRIGRQPDSHVIIRDSRASRNHARIVFDNGEYFLEDAESRHGTLVNGQPAIRHRLENADRIEFGFPDSYVMVFHFEEPGQRTLLGEESLSGYTGGPGSNLAKLRAVLEMARAVETSGSTDEVLAALVDAALVITGTERGFLLLRQGDDLEMRVARDRRGAALPESELRIPRSVINKALQRRRELLSMNFETHEDGMAAGHSVVDLDLRSVVCVPLVRIRTGGGDATNVVAGLSDTAGVLYMDSRLAAADLSAGNRELLQALAIEASTILENARLLEEERAKQRIEEELRLARTIQQSLLPRTLPDSGWFRAAGWSDPSHQVGGDYYDVFVDDGDSRALVVADVSGKGVASALLAALLQGAFVAVPAAVSVTETMARINRFLGDRTEGEKYATIFYGRLSSDGLLRYINAGHCPPLLVSAGSVRKLEATAVPVGLFTEAEFCAAEAHLNSGDKLVIYSDGVTEARNPAGEFFGTVRLREAAIRHASEDCACLVAAIRSAVECFTEGAPQADDITVVVVGRTY